jgi:K+-sensing histidine kinase KdpD
LLYIYSLKTSFSKWTPDLDGAASEYARAGCTSYYHKWFLDLKNVSVFFLFSLAVEAPMRSCYISDYKLVVNYLVFALLFIH